MSIHGTTPHARLTEELEKLDQTNDLKYAKEVAASRGRRVTYAYRPCDVAELADHPVIEHVLCDDGRKIDVLPRDIAQMLLWVRLFRDIEREMPPVIAEGTELHRITHLLKRLREADRLDLWWHVSNYALTLKADTLEDTTIQLALALEDMEGCLTTPLLRAQREQRMRWLLESVCRVLACMVRTPLHGDHYMLDRLFDTGEATT